MEHYHFLGEIQAFPFDFAPRGWAPCDGSLLPINANQALFAIIGTTYGGNGVTNFALPDLRGRTALHVGNGVLLGQRAGEEAHLLSVSEIPSHTHFAFGSSGDAESARPSSTSSWGVTSEPTYTSTPTTQMRPNALSASGGNGAHSNMQPFLVLNYCIALNGIFPPRD
jgi:microcystin-dependent protein